MIYVFRHNIISRTFFPNQYEDWFSEARSRERYRRLFQIDAEICWAKVHELCGYTLSPEVYFWGPRNELVDSARWREGDPIRGTWFDKYLIPQNELRLILTGSEENYRYNEQLRITKVIDGHGVEIA